MEIWGFVISICVGVFSIYTWWLGGISGKADLTAQQKQNELLQVLIEQTNKANSTLASIQVISKEQLKISGELTKLGEIVALVGSQESAEVKAKKVDVLIQQGKKSVADIATSITQLKPEAISNKIGKTGWIYIGKFASATNQWNNKTIYGFNNKNIENEEALTIETEVGFNADKPEFPRYERGLSRVFPYVLKKNTKVKVIDKDYYVGMRDFTWAKVKIIEVPK